VLSRTEESAHFKVCLKAACGQTVGLKLSVASLEEEGGTGTIFPVPSPYILSCWKIFFLSENLRPKMQNLGKILGSH